MAVIWLFLTLWEVLVNPGTRLSEKWWGVYFWLTVMLGYAAQVGVVCWAVRYILRHTRWQ